MKLFFAVMIGVLFFHAVPVHPDPLNTLRGTKKEKVFYLTIDAHNDIRHLDHVLNVLARQGVRATFFLTGYFVSRFPQGAIKIARSGHLVGNHTFYHRNRYAPGQLLRELKETERLYRQVTGSSMTRLWRAPYLQHMGRQWLLRGPHREGFRHVDVTLTTRDWENRFSPRYLANDRYLSAFREGLDFTRYRRMILCGQSIRWRRSRRISPRLEYNGVIMLYHLGRFRKGQRDAIHTLEPVLLVLKKEGYRLSTCQDFLGTKKHTQGRAL